MNLIDKFKRKYYNFGIENLSIYIIITLGAFWAVGYLFPSLSIINYLYFDRSLILQGQVWRIISCMITAVMGNSPIFALISLYFYYFICTSIEGYWGKSAFTLYMICGTVAMNIAGFITGYCMPSYFYLSLFFVYAIINPEQQLLLFFVIPIKVKYLAYIDLLFTIYEFFVGGFSVKISIIASLLLIFLFFGRDFYNSIKAKRRYNKFKNSMK